MMKGVLDRYEGGLAVILVEESKEEFTLEKTELPKGSTQGTWYHLIHGENGYAISSIDVAATEEKSSANALLLEKVQQKKKESKFRRK